MQIYVALQSDEENFYCNIVVVITVKPVLNGPFIKRNFVLDGNIFSSRDYHSIP
jgi:hypothetical protein